MKTVLVSPEATSVKGAKSISKTKQKENGTGLALKQQEI